MSDILPDKKDYVKINTASEILGVSLNTVRRWDEQGILHSERLDGKNRYFLKSELKEFKKNRPLSISEAALALSISISTLRRLEQKGLIATTRDANGERMYSSKMIDEFLLARKKMQKGSVFNFLVPFQSPIASVPVLSIPEKNEELESKTFPLSEASVSSPQVDQETVKNNPLPVSVSSPQVDQEAVKTEVPSAQENLQQSTVNEERRTKNASSVVVERNDHLLDHLRTFPVLKHLKDAQNPPEFFDNTQASSIPGRNRERRNVNYKAGVLTLAFMLLITSGVFVFAVLRPSAEDNSKILSKANIKSQVLAANTSPRQFTVNIQSLFNDNIKVNNKDLDIGTGNLTAGNVLYGITAGNGITITPGQNPVISAVATATGVTSFGSATGAITLGSGLTVTNNTLNASIPSTTNSFATIKANGTNITAGGGTDTLTLTSGAGITLSASGKEITITSTATASDWTLLGTSLYPSSTLDNVGIGNSAPTATLDVTGTFKVSGATTLNGVAYTWPTTQSNSYILQTNGSGTLSWLDPGTLPSSNFFTVSDGTVYPNNPSLDLLVGGNSSASAKFGFVNVAAGIPAIQISGTTVLTGTTLGSGVVNSSLTSTGALSSGSIASGFGTITTANTITGTTLNGTTGINTGATAGTQRIDSSGNLINIGTTQFNTVVYTWPGTDTGLSGYALTTNGSGALSWASAGGLGTNYFSIASGAIYPTNPSLDFLLGASSTTSAKFAVLGINNTRGTQIASISGSLTLDSSAASIQSTSNQNLTLGGDTTGNIILSPLNGAGSTIFNGATKLNGITYSWPGTQNSAYVLQTDGSGNLSWVAPSGTGFGTNYFAISSGAIYPIDTGLDFLIGGVTSASAKFGFLNVFTGTPAIQISGTTVLTGTTLGSGVVNSSLTSTGALVSGSIASGFGTITTANTITGTTLNGTTGINTGVTAGTQRIDSSGNLTNIGTTQFNTVVYTWPGTDTGLSGYALTTNGSGALSWASAGGLGTNYFSIASGAIYPTNPALDFLIGDPTSASAKFGFVNVAAGTPAIQISGTTVLTGTTLGVNVVNSSLTSTGALASGSIASGFGTIETANTITGTTVNGTTGVNTGATTGTQRIDSSGNLANIGTTQINTVTYTWPGTATAGYVLKSGSTGATSTLSWVDPSTFGTNYWSLGAGTISPTNTSLDFLLGNSATTAARFAVLNVNSGTPVASLSAGAAGGAYLTAAGTLQTTAFQNLTLGGSTTGDIMLSPRNGAGYVNLTSTNAQQLRVGYNASNYFTSAVGSTGVTTFTATGGSAGFTFANNVTVSSGGLYLGTSGSTNGILTFYSSGGATAPSISADSSRNLNISAPSGQLVLNGTGDIVLDPSTSNLIANLSSTGDFLIQRGGGTFATFAHLGNEFNVTGGTLGGQAVAIFNQLGTSTNDIIAASSSGNTKFRVTNSGGIVLDSAATTSFGGIAYTWPGSQTSSYVMQTNGAGTLSWVDPGTLPGVFTTGLGAIFPTNPTRDFLIGGSASTSADFAVLNVNNGTPTASLSAGAAGGAYLTAAGNLQTTAFQNLTLGGSTTGNIILNPMNGAAGGQVSPAIDNVTDLGASMSARFRELYLGPSSLHLQCTTGDTCSQNFDWSQSINSATGNFEIGLNGTIANNKSLLTLSQSGILGVGRSGALNGVLALQSSGGGNAPTISSDSNSTLVLQGGTGGDIVFLLAAGEKTYFDGTTTANTTTAGLVDIADTSSTNNNKALAVNTAFTSTGATTSYGIYNTWFSSAVVTGASVSQTAYGLYNTVAKTGADTATGTYTLYGNYNTVSNTGRTNAGTVNTYGGYFTAIGDTNGTTTATGLYASATGATNNYAAIFNGGNVGIGNPTPAAKLDVIGTFSVSGTTTFNSIAYTWPTTQSSSYVLQTNGAGTLSWLDPGTLPGVFTTGFGAIFPTNPTLDFLIGGSASTSAKFAVLGVNGAKGTQTASLSGSLTLDSSTASIQTTNNQSLTLGGNTTGNIILSPLNNTGFVLPGADNTISLGASFSARFKDLFLGPGSLHIQCTVGDGCAQGLDYKLGIDSATGSFNLAANNNSLINFSQVGNVGIGTTAPTAKLEINGTATLTGSELISNGTFDSNDTTGWTLGSDVTTGTDNIISTYSGGDSSNPTLSTTFNTEAGKTYMLTFTVSDANAPVGFWFDNFYYNSVPFSNGTQAVVFKTDFTGLETINFYDTNVVEGDTWTLDNISIKETPMVPALKVIGYDGTTWLSLGGDILNNTALGSSTLNANTTGIRNSAFGHNALSANTSGYDNSVFGNDALSANTTGFQNSAVGSEALISNTTGTDNTAMGYRALYTNTWASANTAVGTGALYQNTGSLNSALGAGSLSSNTTGGYNAAFGVNSLGYNTTADYNTAIGVASLPLNTTGYNNTAIGAATFLNLDITANDGSGNNTAVGYNTGGGIVTGVNNTILGANVTGLASDLSNNIIIADGAGNRRINVGANGYVGIGTTSPGANLDVPGSIKTNSLNVDTITGQDNGVIINKLTSDNVAGSWSTGTAGGTARYGQTSVLYNGRIYSWGGYDVGFLNTMEIYDIASGVWSTGTAGGTARVGHTSILYNGRIYSWGGSDGGGDLNTMDIYDIANDSWSTGSTGGTARGFHSSVVYNGKIYSWGGSSFLDSVDIYDIANDSWSTGTSGGTGRWGQSSVLYNGKIYSWGGRDASLPNNTVDIYDIATDSWSTGASGGTARYYQASVFYNGKMYAWGGTDRFGGTLDSVDIYDIATDSWSTGTSGGTARNEHSSVVYNGKIYSWGGYNNGGNLNTVDIYDIGFRQNILSLQENGQDTLNFQTGSQLFLASGRLGIMGGNVGIGTNLPTAKLEINGASTPTGSNLISNGTFTGNDTTGWTLGSDVTTGTDNVISTYAGGDPFLTTTFHTDTGKTYLLTFTISDANAPMYFSFTNNTLPYSYGPFTNGTATVAFTTNSTGTETIKFDDNNGVIGDTWTLDNISIKETSAISPALKVIGHDGATWLSLGGDMLGNTAIGAGSLTNNTIGYQNSALGYGALLSNTGGAQNSAMGVNALLSNTNGSNNVAVGYSALQSNSTGLSNIALGSYALGANIGSSYNVAIGDMALSSDIGGSNNNAIGFNALRLNTNGNQNNAIGSYALQSNIEGGSNVALGDQALQTNTSGSGNSALGFGTLGTNETGSNNTAVGSGANVSLGDLTNATAIGYNAIVGCSNCLVLGGTGADAVNVGIGMTTPTAATLSIQGINTEGTLGADQITNGDFATNDSGWTAGAGWSYDGGTNAELHTPGDTDVLSQTGTLITGATYTAQFDISGTVGNVTACLDGGICASFDAGTGTVTFTGVWNNSGGVIVMFYPSSDFDGTIDNVSVVQNIPSSPTIALFNSDGSLGLELRSGGSGLNNTFVGLNAGYFNTTGSYNTANGDEALYSNTTGGYNTANGVEALYSNTTGGYNTANGYDALYNNTTGYENTANGVWALQNNTTGYDNTANGLQALMNNTTGYNNTANGFIALGYNTTGYNNTANGVWALQNNTTGSNNTAIGYYADVGANNLTNATAIGYSSIVGCSNCLVLGGTGADAVNVGIGMTTPTAATLSIQGTNTEGTLGTDQITNGDFATDDSGWTAGAGWSYDVGSNAELHTAGSTDALSQTGTLIEGATYTVQFDIGGSTGSVNACLDDGTCATFNAGSGTVTFTGAWYNYYGVKIEFIPSSDFDGTIDNVSVVQNIPSSPTVALFNSDGSVGLELRSGGAGLNNTFVGLNAGYFNTTGYNNTANGYQALYNNTTGSYNTANGLHALYSNTTGYYNTANGVNALDSNTTGYQNTANGYQALYSNTTGYENTANGVWALQSNTTGYDNTANGLNALYSNTTGSVNTANGVDALYNNTTGSNNTANGYEALLSNTTGNANTANGVDALFNTTGDSNTANGAYALLSNTTGSYNTSLGYFADVLSNNLTNATAIGALAAVNCSNCLVLGSINGVNGATSNVNVGIGTTTPGVALDVSGVIRTNNNFYVNGGTSNITSLNDVANVNKNLGANVTDSWSTVASTARQAFTSVLYNGKIYSWGGYGSLNTVDIYDIAGNSWSTGTAGGTGRSMFTSVLYNGKIYSWGGYNGSSTYYNTVDIYDIANNSWSTGNAGGTARAYHTSILYNGKIYSWGGNAGGSNFNTMDIYDIAGNSWSTGASGGTARYSHTSVLYNGKIYSWGGNNAGNLNTVDIYDIAGNSWSTGTAGGTARRYHTSILYNGKIYSWGGYNGSIAINTMDIYDIAGNSWSTGAAGGTARWQHTSVLYNGKIYSWGGGNGSDINTMDIYDIGFKQNILSLQENGQDTLNFQTGSQMFLASGRLGIMGGNLGIGTTSPSSPLSVGVGTATNFGVSSLGDITSAFTTLDGSSTANGSGIGSTSLILNSVTNFNIGNYIQVSSTDCVTGVNVCYAKITNIVGSTLTISPALSWANSSAVVEVHVPELGGSDLTQSLTNRYGRGYFVDGIVAGNGSSYFTDNSIAFGGGSKITDTLGSLNLQAGGATGGSGGSGSINFKDSTGVLRGRLDTATLSGANSDGALSVTSGTTTIDSVETTQNTSSNSTGSTIYAVSTSGISAGDTVMIMQMKGGTPGNYEETVVISVISSTQLSVSPALSNTYSQTTNSRCNGSDTNCAQIVRVPRYTTVTCTGGTITAPAWSTSTGVGGILWSDASGAVSISSSCVVDMNGKGNNGGLTSTGGGGGTPGYNSSGSSGNAPTTPASGGGPNGGGAGGIGGSVGGAGTFSAGGGGAGGGSGGGGGGGNNGAGTAGTAGTSGTGGDGGGISNHGTGSNGSAGSAGSNISPTITSRILMGGGGGGGAGGNGGGGGGSNTTATAGTGGNGGSGGSGGAGGGIIVFHSATSVTNSATIRSTGSNGSNGTNGSIGESTGSGVAAVGGGGGGAPGAGGGGGAGGTVWFNAPSVTAGSITLTAGTPGTAGTTGGNGGSANSGCGMGYGSGSAGAGGGGQSTCGGSGTSASGGSAGAGAAGAAGRTDSSTTSSFVGSSYGTFYISSTNTSSADVAELYHTNDSSIEAGDLVTWHQDASGSSGLSKTTGAYDGNLMGAISTDPGVLLGSSDGQNNATQRPVALSGRVPVKVNAENGPISRGDSITASSTPGVGMKATQAGRVIGMALEDYNPSDPSTVGKISVLVNTGFYYGENVAHEITNSTMLADGFYNTDGSLKAEYKGQILTSNQVDQMIKANIPSGKLITAFTIDAENNIGLGVATPSAKFQVGGAIKSGVEGQIAGAFTIAGEASGSATIKAASNGSTWTMTLPTDAGVNGSVLTTDGAGNTNWVDIASLTTPLRTEIFNVLGASTDTAGTNTIFGKLAKIQDQDIAGINDKLSVFTVVTDAVTSAKNVIFNAPATFNNGITVLQDIVLSGRIKHNDQDTAGIAIIKNGFTTVHVAFDRPYTTIPIITFAANGHSVTGYLQDTTTEGFTIAVSSTATADLNFNWSATFVNIPRVSESTSSAELNPTPTP